MLSVVERYMERIRIADSEVDVVQILSDLCAEFGFRSAYMVDYTADALNARQIIDTNSSRKEWWRKYLENGRPDLQEINERLAKGGVQRINGDALFDDNMPLHQLARKYDMTEFVLVPISQERSTVGALGYIGTPELDTAHESALQLLSYSLFIQLRNLGSKGLYLPKASLTPREKEVMNLAAEGLTSTSIAQKLGMSARTVNQHVDNVADKLGTRNRVHTVVEAVRHGLLH